MADRELARQLGVQPRQIERWRSEGCLQPPEWMHQRGMPGSRSGYPAGAAAQAARVRDLLARSPRLLARPRTSFDEVRILLFWEDRFVDQGKLRGSYQVFLQRLDGQFGPADVPLAADLARALSGVARGGFGLWTSALKLAGDVARPGGAGPRDRVRLALTVLLTALYGATLSSGLPGGPDDLVADAIDNLGFGTDHRRRGRPGVSEPARARELMNEAKPAELEQARELVKTVMAYAQTLAFIGSRTDRSLRWPAFSLVCKTVIKNTGPMLPLCLPFAVAARRQYGPGWDDHIAGLARRAEAAASLLRALPRRLHRLVRADGTPVRYSSRQLNTFQATYSSWAEQHPDLACSSCATPMTSRRRTRPGRDRATRQNAPGEVTDRTAGREHEPPICSAAALEALPELHVHIVELWAAGSDL